MARNSRRAGEAGSRARLVLLGSLLAAFLTPAAFAAGAKVNGAIVVVDDALGGTAGSAVVSAGGTSVAGGLAMPAPVRSVSIRDSFVDGGFFSFPFPFSRLLLIAPGEIPLAGEFPGKTGQPAAHVKGSTFSVTVYATDWFFQPVADAPGDSIRLSTITASETQPPAQTLAPGATTFSGVAVLSTTGTFVLSARDQTDPTIGVSASTLTFSLPAVSSPTVHVNVAQGASYATLGGGIVGTAFDTTGVQRVQLAIRRVGTALYYDKPARTFTLGAQTFSDADLGLRGAASTTWFYTLPDADLSDGAQYAVELVAENPSGLRLPAVSTFTFDSRGIGFAPDDGRATAFAVPVSSAGCEALTATVTVVVGGAGVRPGGALALRLPSGWSRPAGLVAPAPAGLGEVTIVSTAPAFSASGATTTLLNPASFGGAPLGDGWIVVAVATSAAAGIEPGQQVAFSVRARPPVGPQGRGLQRFEVRAQAYSTGTLVAIASPPAVDLTTGSVIALSFREPVPVALGPLQTSPTMQLETVDLCGNPAPPPAGLTVTLEAGSIDPNGGFAVDGTAAFFAEQTGLAITQRFVNPPNSRPAEPGGVYFRTGLAGPRALFVRLTGSTIISDGYRFVDLRASSVSIGGVSIDTGTLTPGATSVVLTTGTAAFVRFTVADPQVGWEVLVATETGFASPLFRTAGQGSPSPQSVSWPGVDARVEPPRAAGPGVYFLSVRAGGGTARAGGLEARIPATAFVFGTVGAAGAGALVRALGRGASPGSFAVASSTGTFEVYGLTAGELYEVRAATRVLVLGQAVELTTATAAGVTASTAGASAGPLAFGAPSAFRLSVALPEPAPAELVGRVAVHDDGYSRLASGSLHFSSGAARSDSGGHAFGQAAGTWTVVAVPAGTYDLDVSIPQVGLSTVVAGRVLAPGQVSDLQLFFARKSAVHGWAILPTTKTFGAWVSVHAALAGSDGPSVYGGAFAAGEPTARSSAPYSLFGLDPGTWTIVARSQGFVSTAATVVIVSTVDAPGVDLRLGLGGVIAGTVTVLGDTGALTCRTALPGGCPASGLVVFVGAYNLSTFASSVTPLRVSTSATVASSSFTLTGLESGRHLVRAYLPGFQLDPAGGVEVTVSTPAVAAASMTLRTDDARLRLNVTLPPAPGGACYGASDFRRVGFFLDLRPEGAPVAGGDLTALAPPATTAFHCSSMTFVSPPLKAGRPRVWLVSGSSGAASLGAVSLAHGSTATYAADLTGRVFTVTGTVTLSGTLTFGRTGGAVTVSSASALAALAPTTSYCLLTATAPV
ncbi:MAG: hypothetical protein HY553_12475, partial [Elusimicrobia bacterium]|nr:hypothetical protein [Elusimicrobiota bacterium]